MAVARRGVTLIELILVMAIIVMLLAMVYPSIEAMYGDVRVQAAADHLRGRLAEARTRAIVDGRPYRLSVKAETGEYRLAPDAPEFWQGGAEPARSEDETLPEPLILEDRLPSDIIFQLGDAGRQADSGGWSTLVVFQTDGSCVEDCSIRLEREGSRPIEITVRSLTGAVTSQTLRLEAGK